MQNVIFILWKFLHVSKLLWNVLKISGREMPQMLLPGCAPDHVYT